MKYIEKNIKNEPKTLKIYRETTPDASYVGFIDPKHTLKEALLKEQGHICGYCMKRIKLKRSSLGRGQQATKPMIEVEHFHSQNVAIEKDLDFENMIGVCNGYSQGDIHCDKSKAQKKEEFKTVNPFDKKIESNLTYSVDGSIFTVKQNKDLEYDLDILLNLNCENLKQARKDTIDLARKRLAQKYPIKRWTKKVIQKEIDEWKSKDTSGKYRQFCQIAVWFWEEQKKRNRYPAE